MTNAHAVETENRRYARDEISSERYYELEQMSGRELETVFLRGTAPDPDDLVGWLFRGMNVPFWARMVGIKKFIKGFYREDDAVYGYNIAVKQNGLREPWKARPSFEKPFRHGFFLVTPVDPTARDNAKLDSVLLDYGRGPNRIYDPQRGIRDYLVQVDPADPDLLLGKAYFRIGPVVKSTNFFILERFVRS